jgi:dipeptidyl aminopeptidase/acylaminoacyl peptidase
MVSLLRKEIGSLIVFFAIGINIFANPFQRTKPVIDTSSYSWPMVNGSGISNNGKYCYYFTSTDAYSNQGQLTLTDQNGSSILKLDKINLRSASFSKRSEDLIFMNINDSIGIINVRSKKINYISDAKDYRLIEDTINSYCLIEKKSITQQILIRDLYNNSSLTFDSISSYSLSPTKMELIFSKVQSLSGRFLSCLSKVNLRFGTSELLWKGSDIYKPVFSTDGEKIAFFGRRLLTDSLKLFVLDRNNKSEKNISIQFDGSLTIDTNVLNFSPNDSGLFFNLRKNGNVDYEDMKASVEVWSYSKLFLPTQFLEEISSDYISNKELHAFYSLQSNKSILLDTGDIHLITGVGGIKYVIAVSKNYPDKFYKKSLRPSFYLINLKTGKRTKFLNEASYGSVLLSPNEKYVVWFSTDNLSYFCYNVNRNQVFNLSKEIKTFLYDDQELKNGRKNPFGIAGWCNEGNSIIIYDRYDAWLIDLSGQHRPINITQGTGSKDKIVFGLISKNESKDIAHYDLSSGDFLLSAFETKTKKSGYYKLTIGARLKLQKLGLYNEAHYISKSNTCYRIGRTGFEEFASASLKPTKALDSNVWLVEKMSAVSSPNYFVTNDFQNFSEISNIHPERNINWITSELLTWSFDSKKTIQGIIYKPQNFDSSRKYPCIITYYEKRSDELNKFLRPNFSDSRIDIPTFVSNGYVVFVPDLLFEQAHNGKSAVKIIASCKVLLSKFNFIDHSKIGLQGHSFGGWTTNYLVTHLNGFKAACEASGVSDQVSGYGQLVGGTNSRQELYEVSSQGSAYGIGVTPWTKPDLYIENSPIFFIDKIKTPLLMMHGENDQSVPFAQALEFFLALRRAAKPSWLLQYIDAGHTLNGLSAKDYSIRVQEFFDHYLKGAPAPLWMTHGIPAKLKQIITGYNLDPSGNCGKDCNVCKFWNEKMKKDSAATRKEIEEKTKSEHWMGGK